MTSRHPCSVGVWRFHLEGGEHVEAAGHVAFEAFARARPELSKLLGRQAYFTDAKKVELVADDCLAPIVDQVAKAWDADPSKLLSSGPKTRQRVEARAALLFLARERFGSDLSFIARASGLPIVTVRDALKFVDGRGGRKVRERLAKMGAAA